MNCLWSYGASIVSKFMHVFLGVYSTEFKDLSKSLVEFEDHSKPHFLLGLSISQNLSFTEFWTWKYLKTPTFTEFDDL